MLLSITGASPRWRLWAAHAFALALSSAFASTELLGAPPARAADFYANRSITIVVGMSAGGGYDTYARTLARHLPRHIPGAPTVLVQNMGGAGSLVAVRNVEANQPKDGTVLLVFDPGLLTQSLVIPEKVRFDFRKLTWLGIMTPDYRICYSYGDRGAKSCDDLVHRDHFYLGATGTASGGYMNGASLRVILAAPVKQILGFPGSSEIRLAIEKGELDGDCGAFSSIPTDWVESGKIHPILRLSRERPPQIPDAIFINDLATTQDQKDLLDVLDAQDEIGRSLSISAQVPPDRIAVLRAGFDDTVRDPAYAAEMTAQGLPNNPYTANQAGAIVHRIMTAPPALLARARPFYE